MNLGPRKEKEAATVNPFSLPIAQSIYPAIELLAAANFTTLLNAEFMIIFLTQFFYTRSNRVSLIF